MSCGETLVRTRGFDGFSYADLASVVGVRTATIHYYFPTKTDLGLALIAAYDARYDAALAEILRSTPDATRRIAAYARLYLEGLEQNLGCLCAVLATAPEGLPAAMRDDVEAFFRKHLAWLTEVIDQGQAGGATRRDVDPRAEAHAIVALLEGALLMERVLDGAEGFRGVIDVLTCVCANCAKSTSMVTNASFHGIDMMTSAQIRAARALLNWTVRDLAERASVHRNTITRAETDATGPGHATASIRAALEAAGVIFVEENGEGQGVRLRKQKSAT